MTTGSRREGIEVGIEAEGIGIVDPWIKLVIKKCGKPWYIV